MLSQGSIRLRQKKNNITSYVKLEGYRAMSECSKYQLLLQTDYVRLGEKYDHLYVYSHILSYIAFTEWSPLFLETKDSCPVEWSDGCCKTIAPCETGWQKLDGFLLLNVRILVPSSLLKQMYTISTHLPQKKLHWSHV
jgi:hypothetical protein